MFGNSVSARDMRLDALPSRHVHASYPPHICVSSAVSGCSKQSGGGSAGLFAWANSCGGDRPGAIRVTADFVADGFLGVSGWRLPRGVGVRNLLCTCCAVSGECCRVWRSGLVKVRIRSARWFCAGLFWVQRQGKAGGSGVGYLAGRCGFDGRSEISSG